MKITKFLLVLFLVLLVWIYLVPLMDYFELSRSTSAFCGWCFGIAYISIDRKIFKDW